MSAKGRAWSALDDPEIRQLMGRAPHVSLEDILENPRFPDARKLYLDRFLGVYGHDPFLVRLLIESGRFLVYHLAVVLDAGQDPARRETWFTIGRLKQQFVASGLGASARQVDHLVARLREVGFLDVVPSDNDRRLRLLDPPADIGDRFGVSRTHVRQLLVAAQDAGLINLKARGGHRVEILPRLWASYDRSIAGGMFAHDLVYGVVTGRQQAA